MSPLKETENTMVYVSPTGKVLEFPKIGWYKRDPNRVYTVMDFADGEYVTFSNFSDDSASTSEGNAWYFGWLSDHGRFINIDEIERYDVYEESGTD